MPPQFALPLIAYALAHFFVDFACGCLVTRHLWHCPDPLLAVILYNAFAFVGQMPLGLVADRLNKNVLVASTGCLLVLLATLSADLLPGWAFGSAVTAGLGNALFHMGGGIDVLNASKQRLSALGLFVSPGALGLFLGLKAGSAGFYVTLLPCIMMAVCVLGLLSVCPQKGLGLRSQNAAFSLKPTTSRALGLVLVSSAALFLVVALRSFVGFQQRFEWKANYAVLLTLALVLGKALGGVLSDRFGLRKTALITLALAALLYGFPASPGAGLCAVFLFNMTMPMTLWALSQLFKGAKGFAFGSLTAALFLGWAVTLNKDLPPLPLWPGLSILTVVSLGLLLLGLVALPKSES